jgi:ribosome-associated translation inhibitor RaiA
MIIFTVIGIFTAIFFFVVILMSIIETRIKNRTKEKFLWNMEKVETANIRGQRDHTIEIEHTAKYKSKMKDNKVNPKMLLSKEELGLKDNRVPDYYIGKNGYEARKVCDNFELPYHLATATTYILRAYHKHDTPIDCIQKAINHLEFELDKLKR